MNKIIVTNKPKSIIGNQIFGYSGGTIFKVVSHLSNSNIGDIVMKTNDEFHPLINLYNGALWGPDLYQYEFEVIDSININ